MDTEPAPDRTESSQLQNYAEHCVRTDHDGIDNRHASRSENSETLHHDIQNVSSF